MCICFEVIDHVLAQADIDFTSFGVVEDNVVELAAVANKFLAVRYLPVPVLGHDVGAVPITEYNAFALMINGIKLGSNARPALEDASGVGSEADDLAKGIQECRFLEQNDMVAFAVAFNGRGKASKNLHPR